MPSDASCAMLFSFQWIQQFHFLVFLLLPEKGSTVRTLAGFFHLSGFSSSWPRDRSHSRFSTEGCATPRNNKVEEFHSRKDTWKSASVFVRRLAPQSLSQLPKTEAANSVSPTYPGGPPKRNVFKAGRSLSVVVFPLCKDASRGSAEHSN